MSKVSIYLNFVGDTEAAFNFYKELFGTEFIGEFTRMGDVPAQPGQPEITEAEKSMIMNVQLPILGGTVIMGTDMIESMGMKHEVGNNVSINLEPDTREETERLFKALSEGGSDVRPLQDMFWGAYWGACVDKYGTRWMFNCSQPVNA